MEEVKSAKYFGKSISGIYDRKANVTSMLNNLRWPTLESRRQHNSITMLYSRAFQPAAHGPHAAREAILCGPRSYTHFNSIS